jgi:CRP-like cAMP-binding protein
MSTLQRALLLREVPLFADLLPEDLAQIADIAREELFHSGEALVREGEKADSLFVLSEGEVQILKQDSGGQRLVATRGEGDFVGEMAIIEAAPRSATVRAVGDVRALVIDAESFEAILWERPDVTRALLRGVSRRMRELR